MSYRSAIFKLTGAADRIQPIAEAKGTQGIYTAPVRLLRCNALTYIYFIRPSARYEFCKSPGAKHMEMKNYLHFFFRLPPPIRASVDSCNFDVYTWRCISSVSRKFRMRLLYPPPLQCYTNQLREKRVSSEIGWGKKRSLQHLTFWEMIGKNGDIWCQWHQPYTIMNWFISSLFYVG